MQKLILVAILVIDAQMGFCQAQKVTVSKSDKGMALTVDGRAFMINGMNWDYFPIGTNYSYSLWDQPDEFICTALDAEMAMLQDMGVNAIRVYTGIQPKWVTYIFEQYDIYTMLNHPFGRYGLAMNETWIPHTDYSDPRARAILLSEVEALARKYMQTPGLLLYLLGNENNYGLFWEGAETEDIPDDARQSRQTAVPMYKLFNEAAVLMKKIDPTHPVALCNGDLLFADIIAEECGDVDIFAVNMYRGISFGDAFVRVRDELDKPILFSEFGADAFNALENVEDQLSQAYYMVGNWQEIYENAYGLGKAGNSIGGFTFQFSDGWWKFGQTENLDVHDTNASWSNGGYSEDYMEGFNNMNEEWFGICAKAHPSGQGFYKLYPRAAFYALKDVHRLDPFKEDMTLIEIEAHFENISLSNAVNKAESEKSIPKNMRVNDQNTPSKN